MNNPECYGKFPNGTSPCAKCDYFDSCRYYAATAKKMNRREKNTVSFETAGFMAETAVFPEIPDAESISEKAGLIDVVGRFFRYLLDLDDYTLAMICQVICGDAGGRPATVSALSGQMGCSRQATHRKLLTIIAEHSELSGFFGSLMPKISRSRNMFWRHRRNECCK